MALSVSHWLALALAILNGGFLVRVFVIQHDCGHGAFLKNRQAQDWIGRVLGVMTLTPYAVWRRTHSIHHAQHGNLDQRGIGDVLTLTIEEYRARSPFWRLMYRLYRHPVVLFVLGPSYLFILQNRLPFGLMKSGWRYWTSAMGTNAMIGIAIGLLVWFGGFLPVLVIFLPTSIIGATIGVWLFYVQHQFEETHWSKGEDWQLHDAALEGSSHYILPQPLRWFSGNIGIHHVHHLYYLSYFIYKDLKRKSAVHIMVIAAERGTPLAEVLRAQAQDVREAGRRAVMEAGGRKEIAMMIPVVFLVLPVTVLFAVFPGFAFLRLTM